MSRMLRSLAVFAALLIVFVPPDQPGVRAQGQLVVRFLDVGQGDGAWLTTPDGKTVLIDCGPKHYGAQLVKKLQNAGVTRVDVLAPSHAHADHMGGCIKVLETFPVGQVLLTGQTDTTTTWQQFSDNLDPATVTTLAAGQTYSWGSSVQVTVYNPPSHPTGATLHEYDDSHVLLVQHGSVTFLFVGDLHQPGEARVLAAGLPPAQVLKVSEHGGIEGSGATFLGHVAPNLAIISASATNGYGHPRPEVMDRLAAAGAARLQTANHGTITVTSDGTRYTVDVERVAPPSATDEDGCDLAYPDFCILPAPPDLDCGDGPTHGRHNFAVVAPDPHGFDPDRDGSGCEA